MVAEAEQFQNKTIASGGINYGTEAAGTVSVAEHPTFAGENVLIPGFPAHPHQSCP
jgi:hypothetical protein